MLQNQSIRYNQYGDPPASLAIVLWKPEENPLFVGVATYNTHPTITFTLNNDLIPWSENGTVSTFFVCITKCWFSYKECMNIVTWNSWLVLLIFIGLLFCLHSSVMLHQIWKSNLIWNRIMMTMTIRKTESANQNFICSVFSGALF